MLTIFIYLYATNETQLKDTDFPKPEARGKLLTAANSQTGKTRC